jgi:hypothetical protein
LFALFSGSCCRLLIAVCSSCCFRACSYAVSESTHTLHGPTRMRKLSPSLSALVWRVTSGPTAEDPVTRVYRSSLGVGALFPQVDRRRRRIPPADPWLPATGHSRPDENRVDCWGTRGSHRVRQTRPWFARNPTRHTGSQPQHVADCGMRATVSENRRRPIRPGASDRRAHWTTYLSHSFACLGRRCAPKHCSPRQ